MTTAYSTLMGLAEPVQGELSGTWGDTVNKGITEYLDVALAGTQTISGTQTAVTLSLTNGNASATNIAQAGSGATGSAQFAIINCTGAPVSLLTITVPASSRQYIVINATSTNQSVKIVGAGPTTGVTLVAGEKAHIAWNGSDFVKVASTVITNLTGTLGTANGGTGLTGFTAGNNALYSTSSSVLTAGTLPVAAGGTGQTSASAAFNALSPITTAGDLIIGNGSNSATRLAIGANGYVLTSNGTTATWAASTGGVTSFSAGTTGLTPSTGTTGAVTLAGTLGVANGGTGLTSTPTNGQIDIGNGTGFTRATLTAGTGISITNGSGSVTIATSGSSSSTGANMYLAANFGAF